MHPTSILLPLVRSLELTRRESSIKSLCTVGILSKKSSPRCGVKLWPRRPYATVIVCYLSNGVQQLVTPKMVSPETACPMNAEKRCSHAVTGLLTYGCVNSEGKRREQWTMGLAKRELHYAARFLLRLRRASCNAS